MSPSGSDDQIQHVGSRPNPNVAVIGAGIAGLTAARALQAKGLSVTVFEKSRGPSGRMSTRRSDGSIQFDHGAQYFTARDPSFQRIVRTWEEAGLVNRWKARFGVITHDGFISEEPRATRWVGSPRMSVLCRNLSQGLILKTSTRIGAMRRAGTSWLLQDDAQRDLGSFDEVIVAVPAAQAAPLLTPAPSFASIASSTDMAPCQTLMLAFPRPLNLPLDAARVQEGPLAWVARDSSKPGRPPGERWVAQATPESSTEHLEETASETVTRLLSAFQSVTGNHTPPSHAVAHRWRYARTVGSHDAGPPALYDSALHLGVAGDWLIGARVEAAWQSGVAVAERLLGSTSSAEGSP